MARRVETREIEGSQYKVTALPFRKNSALLERIGELLAPSIEKAVGGLGRMSPQKAAVHAVEALGDLSSESFGESIGAFLRGAPGRTEWLLGELRETIQVCPAAAIKAGGREFVPLVDALIDDWSSLEGYKVIAFALEVNYAGFFEGFGGLKAFMRKAVTPSNQARESP